MAAIGRASNYKQVLKKVEREKTQRLRKALQNTVIDATSRLVDRTPVDTGAAKFHWFVRLLPDERFDENNTDPSGSKPKSQAKRDVKLFRAGQKVYIVNSAPYFVFLENGSSKQAPQGIVAITLAEISLIWQREFSVAFSKEIIGIDVRENA